MQLHWCCVSRWQYFKRLLLECMQLSSIELQVVFIRSSKYGIMVIFDDSLSSTQLAIVIVLIAKNMYEWAIRNSNNPIEIFLRYSIFLSFLFIVKFMPLPQQPNFCYPKRKNHTTIFLLFLIFFDISEITQLMTLSYVVYLFKKSTGISLPLLSHLIIDSCNITADVWGIFYLEYTILCIT